MRSPRCLVVASCVAVLAAGCVRKEESARVVSARFIPGVEQRVLPQDQEGATSQRFRVVITQLQTGLVLRVEQAQRCAVTRQLEVRKELTTERYVPGWVYGVSGAIVAGGFVAAAVRDDPNAILSGLIIGGAVLAFSLPFAGESTEPLPPDYTPQTSIEDCGFHPHGPHRISFGSGASLTRVHIPPSGSVQLPGLTREHLVPLFLDGNPVELMFQGAPPAP